MNLVRALLASLFSLACTLAVSGFVLLLTMQTTVLNRQEVKTWVQHSGAYSHVIDTSVTSDPAIQQQLSTVSNAVSQHDLVAALSKTFPPSYIQQQSEKVIDSTYNWLDGKQS